MVPHDLYGYLSLFCIAHDSTRLRTPCLLTGRDFSHVPVNAFYKPFHPRISILFVFWFVFRLGLRSRGPTGSANDFNVVNVVPSCTPLSTFYFIFFSFLNENIWFDVFIICILQFMYMFACWKIWLWQLHHIKSIDFGFYSSWNLSYNNIIFYMLKSLWRSNRIPGYMISC